MPTIRPQWPSADDFAEKVIAKLETGHAADVTPKRAAFKATVIGMFQSTWWLSARKMSRLCEKLKDQIEAEAFGDLFRDNVGNRVAPADYDPDNPTHLRTQAYEILLAFKEIYDLTFLDQFDEEGNFIP